MRRICCAAACVVTALTVTQTDAGTIRFVDDGAPPGGDGLAWSTAYRYLQDALQEALGGNVTEVRVARGSYQPDRADGGGITPGSRSASFQLIDGVALRGGFAGPGAPDPDARDIDLYKTVVTGDLLGDDAPGFINYADNSLHVLTGSDVDDTAELDGFTITGGNANVASDDFGGGVRLQGSSPAVTACTFVANRADAGGGALANIASAPTVLDCLFLSNAGGAVESREASNPLVCNCTFTDNAGGFGAGMDSEDGSLTLDGCTFLANEGTAGGAVRIANGQAFILGCVFLGNQTSFFGGAIWTGSADTTISGCTFTGNNAAESDGGAIAITGTGTVDIEASLFTGNSAAFGGALITAGSNTSISDCTFGGPEPGDGNSAITGGAVYNLDTSPSLTGCTFTGNAAEFAGALINDNADATIIDCEFSDNAATVASGALENFDDSDAVITGCTFSGNGAVEGGGAMRSYDFCDAVLSGCVFTGNQSGVGGALVCFNQSNMLIEECVFDENTASGHGGALVIFGSHPVVTACRFTDNQGSFGGAVSGDSGSVVAVNCLLAGNEATIAGGAIAPSVATLVNCTIVLNSAVFAGGIYSGTSSVTGCILRGNGPDPIQFGTATVAYSDVEGGWPGTGNIDADAMFVDAGTGDFNLSAGSPCIDAADNTAPDLAGVTTDLGGDPRFVDDPDTPDSGNGGPPVVDMGAYEFQVTSCPWDCGGSSDGVVGIDDFLALLAQWGQSGTSCDFGAGSPNVGVDEFLRLLANWGPCP